MSISLDYFQCKLAKNSLTADFSGQIPMRRIKQGPDLSRNWPISEAIRFILQAKGTSP